MNNIATVSLPATAIARLTAAVASLPGVRFAGVTYRSKESNELARHTLILGADYGQQCRMSLDVLAKRPNIQVDVSATRELLNGIAAWKTRVAAFEAMAKDSPNYNGIAHDEAETALADTKQALKRLQNIIGPERSAASELYISLEDSLSAFDKGEQNAAYTKAGLYETICPGLKVSRADGTFELCGLQHSKKVLEAGVFPVVNSAPKTIAKNKIRSALPVGRYRTLCLDAGFLDSVRIGGSEIDVS